LRANRLNEHTAIISARREVLRDTLARIIEPSVRFVWEVGSGHGHFLTAYAAAHAHETCVGIDIASERVVRAELKRQRSGLEHLHFVRADAEDFLASMPQSARFTSVFILFPDPWPKRRHHKNRIMTHEFLAAVAARSAKGARLFFRTDHEPYFRGAALVLREHANWIVEESAALPFEEPTVFQKRAAHYFTLVATRR
jgi:tRNA (guanine-N7-)-methyltransferase